jgi:hypothetical protein
LVNITSVGISAGVPNSGTGTVSTLDGIFQSANGPISVKLASTAAVATDPAMVVAISPNNSVGVTGTNIAATDGLTYTRFNSAASTNATSVKAGAGRIYGFDVYNMAAYYVFLKFYNKASAPTVGTDTPVWTVPLAPGGGFSLDGASPEYFATGIAFAITKLQADTDVTVIAAGDVTGRLKWI